MKFHNVFLNLLEYEKRYPTPSSEIIDLKFMIQNGPFKAHTRSLWGFWAPKIHPVVGFGMYFKKMYISLTTHDESL